MKKAILTLLTVITMFSLCACNNLSKKSDFIGTWEGINFFGDSTIITIKDNGTGSYVSESSKFTFTWELKGEDTIVIDKGDDISTATINRDVNPYELTYGFTDPFVKSN